MIGSDRKLKDLKFNAQGGQDQKARKAQLNKKKISFSALEKENWKIEPKKGGLGDPNTSDIRKFMVDCTNKKIELYRAKTPLKKGKFEEIVKPLVQNHKDRVGGHRQ